MPWSMRVVFDSDAVNCGRRSTFVPAWVFVRLVALAVLLQQIQSLCETQRSVLFMLLFLCNG